MGDNLDILQHGGGAEVNDLRRILNLETFETQNPRRNTKYHNINDLIEFLNTNKGIITILSLNIESLNAKFDELKSLIDTIQEQNVYFSIICIQEARLSEESYVDQFQITNYKMVTQNLSIQCSKKGGLVTYISDQFHIKKHQSF